MPDSKYIGLLQPEPFKGPPYGIMNASYQIIVSLSSFGSAEVKRHGQAWFVRLCHAAGADGVEIRGELLQGRDGELAELAAAVQDTGVACVYSSPDMLWSADGTLNVAALDKGLVRAATLHAPVLKMSIGAYAEDSSATLSQLQQRLAGQDIKLVIENDQTESAGSLHALQNFFHALDAAQLHLGMTFDMGNWHWVGECPSEAARMFSDRVHYVHCKGVQRQPNRWVAVPLSDSAAPWRSLMRAMPANVPYAIEYPLVGEDLLGVTKAAVQHLRELEKQR